MSIIERPNEYNFLPEVRKGYNFPREVYIVDNTIRSLQSGASGGFHKVSDIVKIGKALDDLGVRELIVQLSWQEGPKICEKLAEENLRCKVVGTSRAYESNWKTLAETGMKAGVDEICFESIMQEDQFEEAAEVCGKYGRTLSHGFSDIYTYDKVVSICKRGIQYGVKSYSFHDSFSLFRFQINPEGIKYFVSRILKDVPDMPPIYVHLSNVFGHATMTAAAAIVAGATAPDVAMNGIGHHAGHIPLEEIVLVLEGLYGIDTGIDLGKLYETSKRVSKLTGIPVPLAKPVVGDFAFLVDAYYKSDEINAPSDKKLHSRFPFDPEVVGSREKIIWSDRQISIKSITWKLSSMKLPFNDSLVSRITKRIKQELEKKQDYPKWFTDTEIENLIRDTLKS